MIERMKAAGIIRNRGQPPKLNVVACAIAMYLDPARTKDDRALKALFSVAKDSMVRRDWVDGGFVDGQWVEAKFVRLAAHESAVRKAEEVPLDWTPYRVYDQ